MIKKYLYPTYYFDDIYKITPEFLLSRGIKALICDIDNTLVTYDDPEPTPSVMRWFDTMSEAGIKISFVSNNDRERVERFNRTLGYFASAKSGKPRAKALKLAMESMGSDRMNTAMLGDQLFTDVFAGSHIGLRTILVPPIRDKKTPLFRFKRALERPILRAYFKKMQNA